MKKKKKRKRVVVTVSMAGRSRLRRWVESERPLLVLRVTISKKE